MFSTLGGLLGALIFKKQTPPGVIDIPADRPARRAARCCAALPRRCTSLSRILHTEPKFWDVDWVFDCSVASRWSRAGRAGAAPRAGADADAAADPARRARAGRRSRQPHVHADVRAAGPDEGSAAAARPRHQPERRPRPGDRRHVHRRAEERHRAPGARPDPAAARPRLHRSTAASIRVFRREAETRIFDLNYIATERTGAGDGGAPTAAAHQRERHDARPRPTCSRSSRTACGRC